MGKTVLFICTGNTCRSPMAEALLRERLQEENLKIEVVSAGLSALEGERAAAQSVKALEKIGVDLKKHRSKVVTPEIMEKTKLILTMTRGHKEQLLEMMPEIAEKIYTLKEFVRLDEDDLVQKLNELDREEAALLWEFKAEKGQEEKKLLARRAQLQRQLQEIEEKLYALQGEKEKLLQDVRERKAELLEDKRGEMDILDPFGSPLPVYEQTRDEINSFLDQVVKKLKEGNDGADDNNRG